MLDLRQILRGSLLDLRHPLRLGGIIITKKITDKEIIEELADNLEDHTNPHDYTLMADISRDYDLTQSALSQRFDRLEEKGYIELDHERSFSRTNLTFSRSKVYTPTKKGLEYGGIELDLRQNTGGPKITNHDRPISVRDIHGDLYYRYEVLEQPNNDVIDWDQVNELNNGVIQKIKTIENETGKATIQMFKGPNSCSIIMNPKLLGNDVDELRESLKALSWAIYTDLKRYGYDIGMPEQKGEAKWTAVVNDPNNPDDLPEKGEYNNFLIDESRDEKELHPRTGDLDSNAEMIKMLEDTGELAKASRKIEKLEDKVEAQSEILSRQSEALDKMAGYINNLLEALQGPEQPDIEPNDPGGRMYG